MSPKKSRGWEEEEKPALFLDLHMGRKIKQTIRELECGENKAAGISF